MVSHDLVGKDLTEQPIHRMLGSFYTVNKNVKANKMIVQNTVLIYPIVLGTNKSASSSQIVQVVALMNLIVLSTNKSASSSQIVQVAALICLIVLSVKKSVKMRKLFRPEKLITDTK